MDTARCRREWRFEALFALFLSEAAQRSLLLTSADMSFRSPDISPTSSLPSLTCSPLFDDEPLDQSTPPLHRRTLRRTPIPTLECLAVDVCVLTPNSSFPSLFGSPLLNEEPLDESPPPQPNALPLNVDATGFEPLEDTFTSGPELLHNALKLIIGTSANEDSVFGRVCNTSGSDKPSSTAGAEAVAPTAISSVIHSVLASHLLTRATSQNIPNGPLWPYLEGAHCAKEVQCSAPPRCRKVHHQR